MFIVKGWYKLKSKNSEKGLTLVEILVSIVLLSIIFLSIIKFFPQMGFLNKENENKTIAINYVKEILNQWQNSNDVVNFLKNPTTVSLYGYNHKDNNYYYFKTKQGDYDVNIKIKINTDLNSAPIKTHLIDIQLKKGNIVSETYGYIVE
jgi:prepilin-type N-terminal cleavage/methylation domain-containing protein